MDDQPDCYVAGSLAAMLRVSRLGGIAPLNFVKSGSGWRVSLSRGWSYYGYFIITIIMVASILALIIDHLLDQEHTVLLNKRTTLFRTVATFGILNTLLISLAGVFTAPAHMMSTIACMNRVHKINLELNIRHRPMFDEKKNTKIFTTWATFTIMLSVSDYFKLVYGCSEMNQLQKWTCATYFFYYLCFVIKQLCQNYFVMISLHVMYCLKGINILLANLLREVADRNKVVLMILFNEEFSYKKNLKENMTLGRTKCFERTANNIIDSGKTPSGSEGLQELKSIAERVRRLARAYANTCDVVHDVDDGHGPLVLILLGCFLMHLVCTPYFLITIFYQDYGSSDADWVYSQIAIGFEVIWTLYHLLNLLIVVESCHLTHFEMETTRYLVSHLVPCTSSTDPISFELDIFMKHIFLNRASYSAMQVTTVSRPLLVTIFGSITTYLVIMMQM